MNEALPLADALIAESLAYATLQNGPEFSAWRAANRQASAAPTESGPAVLIERTRDHLQLTLNRPANRNGMTVEMRDALCEALQLARSEEHTSELQSLMRISYAVFCLKKKKHQEKKIKITPHTT